MLEVNNYSELLALHKAIMVAKFSDAGQKELLGSPFLAEVARKNMEALVEAERDKNGDAKAAGWTAWRQVDESRNEWGKLIACIDEIDHLKNLGDDEIASIIRDILSPLEITDEQISMLVENRIKVKG